MAELGKEFDVSSLVTPLCACGAAAQYVAMTPAGTEFSFCENHWQSTNRKLQPPGVVIDLRLSAGLCDALADFDD